MNPIIKKCSRCGQENEHRWVIYKGHGKYRSYCRHCEKLARRIRDKHRRRDYAKIKQQIIEYLGGKCLDCNLIDQEPAVYDCHHKDSTQKEYGICQAVRVYKSFAAIKKELDKCVLLCATCHRRRHAKERRDGSS